MNGDRWRRIEELFHRAAELPLNDRAAFLSSACAGDDELRREVETLLANDDPESNLLEAAVTGAAEQLPDASTSSEDLVGKRIGTYVITGLIGKGGMGMVFKARDTQLNRSVAVKALPPDSVADPERKRRLLQEAKATSALNHPNIVTVFGIVQEGGTDFLIMEYVAGKTLDQLVPRKGLPMKQALKYGMEVADALVAAHATGVVHRDIKPSNIMVTEQGRVKVLDFGLAKLAEPDKPAEETSTAAPDTKAGLVFGTAAYMSPEQAEGKRADARSDIFAFGALLYEMVTGRRAFQGQNVITILAAVMNQEPAPAHTLAAASPPELEWLITRCLKKDPQRRIQHIVEVKLALSEVLDGIESPSAMPAPAKPRRRGWLGPAIVALVLGLAPGAWLGERIFRKEPITFQRVTFRHGDVLAARFAPGGSIVYGAEWDGAPLTLFSAQPGNREARDLELPSSNILSVSPSGEMAILMGISELGTQGTLAQVPLGGGAPREVLENVLVADWDPAGKSLAVVRTLNGRHRVEYPIGNVLYETQSLRPPPYLRVSPKGDQVAFFDSGEVGDYSLTVVDSERKPRVLSRGWRTVGSMAWSPDGREIWFFAGGTSADPALYAVDLSGRLRMLTEITGWAVLHDVGRDGRLLLANVDSRIGIRCLPPGAREERDLGWQDASNVYELSNDGKVILFAELSFGEGQNPAIYLRRTDGAPAVRLGYGNRPALSPDGKWVVCVRRDGENSKLLLLPTGAGEAKVLPVGGIRPETGEWFPEGKRILFTGSEVNQPVRTYAIDVAGGKPKAVTAAGVRASRVSPDGRFAVVIASGKVYLHPLDGGADTELGEAEPRVSVIRWSGDGRAVFLQRKDPGNRGVTILRIDVRTHRKEVWRELRTQEAKDLFGSIRLSSDGKSYAFSFQRDLATLYIVRGVK